MFFATSLCVVLLSQLMVLLPGGAAQRPFYAARPWQDYYPNQENNAAAGAPAVSAPQGAINLGTRIFTPTEDNVSFRYFNNVPIQGPDSPCVGCTYMLTKNGFIKV